mgnify:CR=1 FL=1
MLREDRKLWRRRVLVSTVLFFTFCASRSHAMSVRTSYVLRLGLKWSVNVFKKNARGLWDSNEENTPDNAGTGPNQSDPFTNNFNSSCES